LTGWESKENVVFTIRVNGAEHRVDVDGDTPHAVATVADRMAAAREGFALASVCRGSRSIPRSSGRHDATSAAQAI
jgi:hypothetical protein